MLASQVDDLRKQWRQKSSVWLRRLAIELKWRSSVVDEARCYVERYFAVRSLAKNDARLVEAAALLLAGQRHGVQHTIRQLALAMLLVKHARQPDMLRALAIEQDKVLYESGLMRTVPYYVLDIQVTLGEQLTGYPVLPALVDYLACCGVTTLHSQLCADTADNSLTLDQQKALWHLAAGLVPPIFKTPLCVLHPAPTTAAVLTSFASQHLGLHLPTLTHEHHAALMAKHGSAFSFTDDQYQDVLQHILQHVHLSPLPVKRSNQPLGDLDHPAHAPRTPSPHVPAPLSPSPEQCQETLASCKPSSPTHCAVDNRAIHFPRLHTQSTQEASTVATLPSLPTPQAASCGIFVQACKRRLRESDVLLADAFTLDAQAHQYLNSSLTCSNELVAKRGRCQ